jgi:molecular chaperone GrpE
MSPDPILPAEKIPEGEIDKIAPTPVAPPLPDYYDQLLRLRAEFENYRKRVEREKPELYRLGRADVIVNFIPLYDLLRKAHEEIQISHAQSEIAKGMEGIFKEFEKIFKEEDVSVMEALNQAFDPARHEALGAVEAPGVKDGTVVEVFQSGYLIAGRVLRTAKVRIARNNDQPKKEEETKEK